MTETAQYRPAGRLVERDRIGRLADGLAVAVAISLPWSTTATGVLIVLWLIALLPTIDFGALRRTLLRPAALLPTALCLLALVGMAWADADAAERFSAWKVFARLLVIALLLMQFQRSERGAWVVGGFLASSAALLLLSWTHWLVHPQFWRHHLPGVPVKDYVIQSGEFLICAFALGHLALDAWLAGRRARAVGFSLLGLLFLANIVYVAAGRSMLLAFGVLVVVFGVQRFGWKGAAGVVAGAVLLSGVAWTSSPYLRGRVHDSFREVSEYQATGAATSSGFRLEFWRKSILIVSQAPVFGHGTGSLREQFRRAAVGSEGIAAIVTDNPHNQILVIAIQLGLVGTALLLAMWAAHLLLLRGNGLAAMLGTGVVLQNIVAGLFNTSLFEFTLGWLYVFGVGVLGGMALRAGAGSERAEGNSRATP